MSNKPATVVLVPRERYSAMAEAIESLYAHTPDEQFDLIVVDGAVPDHVRAKVNQLARKHGFEFIHHDYPLTPNEARNIGLARTQTKYVVWSDNDVQFTDGWLEKLIATADEYDAWLCGPTILEGPAGDYVIHSAAGTSSLEGEFGKREYHFVPDFEHQKFDDARPNMERGPVTMLEFHVMMARTDIFKQLGPLDEKVMGWFDHDDLTHTCLAAGGNVIFEPDSIIHYHNPGNERGCLEPADLPYFFLRWSDEWADIAVDHVVAKWGIDTDHHWPAHARQWVRSRRHKRYREISAFGRVVSSLIYRIGGARGHAIDRWFCRRQTARLFALRAKHLNGAITRSEYEALATTPHAA